MRWWWVVLAVAGCNPYRKVLLENTFVEVCPGGNPERAWLRFERSGQFSFSYPAPDAWTGDADERWRMAGHDLIVSWNDGFAITRYRLDERKDKAAPGTSTKDSCAETVRLEVVGPR